MSSLSLLHLLRHRNLAQILEIKKFQALNRDDSRAAAKTIDRKEAGLKF